MIYANGSGVPRNADLALKFACEIEDEASAEQEARINHLLLLRQMSDLPVAPPFDLCDNITSGFMGAYCEGKRVDIGKRETAPRIQAVIDEATPAQRAAFDKLPQAG